MNCLLRSTINQIQNKIIKLQCDINHGGCIVFAELLSKELEQRDIKYKLVIMEYYKSSLISAYKGLTKQQNYTPSVQHVAIKIDDLIIDGEKSIKKQKIPYSYFKFITTSHKILKNYRCTGDWNPMFDKELYFNKIKNIIKKEFLNYDKIKNMP